MDLQITGRRADGMHLLRSRMVLINLVDTVHLTPRADGKIVRDWRHDAVSDADDLAMKAARQLQAAAGEGGGGVGIRIEKRIPVGGGLGGASANAAAVLLGLNRLWGLEWDNTRLLPLAAELGADVPFFLQGRAAVVSGIGDVFAAAEDIPPRAYLLVFPPVVALTAAVFAEYARRQKAGEGVDIPPSLQGSDNALTAAAAALYPPIAAAAQALHAAAGQARLSGSGSTVFAEFPDEAAAEAAQQRLPAQVNSAVAAGMAEYRV